MICRNLLFHFQWYMIFFLSFHTIEYCCSIDSIYWNYIDSYCGKITYNPGSIYRTNLNFLLDTLSSNASRTDNNGFYNFSTGDDPSNRVYGLFLCRGDVKPDVCKECVADAHTRLLDECPNQTAGIAFYEECLVRFSDQTIISKVDIGDNLTRCNPFDVPGTDWENFRTAMVKSLQNASIEAAMHTSGKKFAIQDSSYSADQNPKRVYTQTQCTPDLSTDDCLNCLAEAIAQMLTGCYKQAGGRILFPSCNLRYETFEFYRSASLAPLTGGPRPSSAKGKETSFHPGKGRSTLQAAFPIAVPLIMVAIVLFIMTFVFLKRRLRKRYVAMELGMTGIDGVADILTAESLQYSIAEIQIATNNFCVDKKIGEGGFGRVYKGMLGNGQEVAVKRLSRSSVQGAEEFKNEILVVAKLQHRNLVLLLGFCLEGEEKILIYEFVPNKSLDYFLFDPKKKQSLNWSSRYNIIGGIARGLLYLHEDSRLKIVHRDLKASNILLDGNMSPKIADFGMAKIFGVDQSVANTNRIAGTFGYMAPEYTRCGQFSVKSDVYSFGVVILEIVTGKKNSSFYISEDSEGLLSYAWKHWRSGDPLALLDSIIGDFYVKNEVIQCVQVGLLCVEEDVSKRPTMASVVQMLSSGAATLPTPHRPAVSRSHRSESMVEELEVDQFNSKRISAPGSVNLVSTTEVHPR